MTVHKTREEWLAHCATLLIPYYPDQARDTLEGAKIRYSCGFPSSGAKGKAIGECWKTFASADNTAEIFINPSQSDPARVADILAHELIHVALPDAGHGPAFKKAAHYIGLAGKMTSTTAGEKFEAIWAEIAPELGDYPHAELKPGMTNGKKKQTTRLIKCECPECGYTVRTTAKWLDIAEPVCPVCQVGMDA